VKPFFPNSQRNSRVSERARSLRAKSFVSNPVIFSAKFEKLFCEAPPAAAADLPGLLLDKLFFVFI